MISDRFSEEKVFLQQIFDQPTGKGRGENVFLSIIDIFLLHTPGEHLRLFVFRKLSSSALNISRSIAKSISATKLAWSVDLTDISKKLIIDKLTKLERVKSSRKMN